jgi:hypothetical protein
VVQPYYCPRIIYHLDHPYSHHKKKLKLHSAADKEFNKKKNKNATAAAPADFKGVSIYIVAIGSRPKEPQETFLFGIFMSCVRSLQYAVTKDPGCELKLKYTNMA